MVRKFTLGMLLLLLLLFVSSQKISSIQDDQNDVGLVKRMYSGVHGQGPHTENCSCRSCHDARLPSDARRFLRPDDVPHSIVTEAFCCPCNLVSDSCIDTLEIQMASEDAEYRRAQQLRHEQREAMIAANRTRGHARQSDTSHFVQIEGQNDQDPSVNESESARLLGDHVIHEPARQTMRRSCSTRHRH